MFIRVAGAWSQQAYVKPSNTGAGDLFGHAVALAADGSALAVGAILEDSAALGLGGDPMNDSGADSGAVYLFRRTGSTWLEQSYIKPPKASSFDRFGFALALSDDSTVLAVSAFNESSNATGINGNPGGGSAPGAGAVYLY